MRKVVNRKWLYACNLCIQVLALITYVKDVYLHKQVVPEPIFAVFTIGSIGLSLMMLTMPTDKYGGD